MIDGDNPEVNKMMANMTAPGRVGQPDDIGPMIASLLSVVNRWVNAQLIEVSGGMAVSTETNLVTGERVARDN